MSINGTLQRTILQEQIWPFSAGYAIGIAGELLQQGAFRRDNCLGENFTNPTWQYNLKLLSNQQEWWTLQTYPTFLEQLLTAMYRTPACLQGEFE